MRDDPRQHHVEESPLIDIVVQTADHLGIVVGIVDELGVVETSNGGLGPAPHKQISAGIAGQAMILNGVGFVSAPLYVFEQFFKDKATEHPLRELRLNNIPPTLLPIHPATVLSRYFIFKPIPQSRCFASVFE
ncbi:MAG: DUF4277 domain-containing protein [Cyanobacteria bacterium P01_F01_bin.56]